MKKAEKYLVSNVSCIRKFYIKINSPPKFNNDLK